ncbi:hypothetical protein PRZ48_001238 [Zasmidium cellare]|uniref:Uncharacterized protein n=1 Tax=Zasmidium cellare TaxID=395010 RepID=A0ABR0F340_ZASCE|nr:hypothetical protein PRZ48_001238 [Zasmidium cellare]
MAGCLQLFFFLFFHRQRQLYHQPSKDPNSTTATRSLGRAASGSMTETNSFLQRKEALGYQFDIPATIDDSMHSQSRKWINPKVQQEEKLRRYNTARRKLCKDSFAWPLNYDFDVHEALYTADVRDHLQKAQDRRIEEMETRKRLKLPPIRPTAVKPAMAGKQFGNNRSTVLSQKTVFTPQFEVNREDWDEDYGFYVKEVAEWQSKEEAKYEGDERVFTEVIHGRFLGLPRVAGNETVNWQQRSVVRQYQFDDFYLKPTEHDVFWRYNKVNELEINDDTGCKLIGNQLMGILDE